MERRGLKISVSSLQTGERDKGQMSRDKDEVSDVGWMVQEGDIADWGSVNGRLPERKSKLT